MKGRVALLVTVAAITGSCGDGSGSSATEDAAEVTVFAASSLTDAFEDIGRAYQMSNPSVEVRFNFLASSDLAAQITQGAPADVFASADEPTMERLVDQGLIGSRPEIFARNRLSIAVPADNPGGVRDLTDLATDDLVVSLCVEECPAGRYALAILSRAGIEVEPDSLEPEVRAVVTRVELGEADAGIVYATDVLAAGDDVKAIEIPAEDNLIASYPVATIRGAGAAAADFVDFVLSHEGRRILDRHGFMAP